MPLGDTAILDLFGTDGGPPPPGPWATLSSFVESAKAGGGLCYADATTLNFHGIYRTDVNEDDVEVHFLIDTVPHPGLDILALFRVDVSALDGYAASFQNVNGSQFDWQVVVYEDGNQVDQLGASVSQPFAPGDRVGVRMIDTTIQMWHRPGDTGTPNVILTRNDSTYAAPGRIGVAFQAGSFPPAPAIRDFGGGAASPPDTTPPGQATGLTLSEPTPGTLRAAFTMPATSDASAYRVRYKAGASQTFSGPTDGSQHTAETAADPSEALTADLEGFAASATYTVAVFVRDTSGNYNTGVTANRTMDAADPDPPPGGPDVREGPRSGGIRITVQAGGGSSGEDPPPPDVPPPLPPPPPPAPEPEPGLAVERALHLLEFLHTGVTE